MGAANAGRIISENLMLRTNGLLTIACNKSEAEADIESRINKISEQARKILNKEITLEMSTETSSKKDLEIALLKCPNLGHQFWNQYSTCFRMASFLNAYYPDQGFIINYDESTNYFPAESLSDHFETTTQKQDTEIYISPGNLIYIDAFASKASYRESRHALTSYLAKKSRPSREILNYTKTRGESKKGKKKIVIFSLKAGNASFSGTLK